MPTIKFAPSHEVVGGFAPAPIPVSSAMPEWFRKLHPYQNNEKEIVLGDSAGNPHGGYFLNATAKKCMSMIDTFTTGYYFLCPVDIYFDTTDEENIQMKWRNPQFEFVLTHAKEQIGDYPINDNYCETIFRWVPWWMAVTPPGYSTLFMHPVHRLDLPFVTMTGIIDTDEMPSSGALPFNIRKGFKGIIKRGTPIAQVIPFKREEWDHEILGEVTTEIRDRLNLINASFSGMYKDNMWEKQSYK